MDLNRQLPSRVHGQEVGLFVQERDLFRQVVDQLLHLGRNCDCGRGNISLTIAGSVRTYWPDAGDGGPLSNVNLVRSNSSAPPGAAVED